MILAAVMIFVFILTFEALLHVRFGKDFRSVLVGSISFSVAVTCSLVMVAEIVATKSTITAVCRSYTYDFKVLSEDHTEGVLTNGAQFNLPRDVIVKYYADSGHVPRLEITTYCAVRMSGWWTPFDLAGMVIKPNEYTETVLYLASCP